MTLRSLFSLAFNKSRSHYACLLISRHIFSLVTGFSLTSPKKKLKINHGRVKTANNGSLNPSQQCVGSLTSLNRIFICEKGPTDWSSLSEKTRKSDQILQTWLQSSTDFLQVIWDAECWSSCGLSPWPPTQQTGTYTIKLRPSSLLFLHLASSDWPKFLAFSKKKT